jgi:hypothetical protein
MALEGVVGCVSGLPCKSLVFHGNLLIQLGSFTVICVSGLPCNLLIPYLDSIACVFGLIERLARILERYLHSITYVFCLTERLTRILEQEGF